MKKLLKNNYIFSIVVLMLLTLLPLLGNNLFSMILCPILFLLICIGYGYLKKVKCDLPFILLIVLLVYFYLFSFSINGLSVLFSIIFGYVGLFISYKLYGKKDKKDKEDKRINALVSALIPLFIMLSSEVYYKICTFGNINFNISLSSLVITILIIYSIYAIITIVTRSTFRANVILSIIFLLLFLINQSRIFYTSDTLLVADINFLKGAAETVGFIDVTFINMLEFLFYPTIYLTLTLGYYCFLSKKYCLRCKSLKTDLLTSICAIVILSVLLTPINGLDKFLLNNVYASTDEKDYSIAISNTKYYDKYTVIGGMYGKYLESRRYEPSNYNEEELKEILQSSKKKDGNWDKPNVIAIFSESFWDIGQLDTVSFNTDIISNFHKLSVDGKLVNMISPVYGGFSGNTEFQILTGASMNYFSKGYVPYMQLYTNNNSYDNPSIIKEFNNNGYYTKILNSSGKYMYNCDKVYEYMSVKQKRHLYNEFKSYVTDEYLTDEIIKSLTETPDPLFMMAITMGGHMPYYKERYENYNVEIVESKNSVELDGIIQSYAEGIYKADEQLGRLYDYIKTIDEKTIIVFFGDHLPHLQASDGTDILETSNYFNTGNELKDIYRRYNTQALIIGNYNMDYDDIDYLSPDLLMPYVLNNLNVELSPYYNFLYNTIDVIPSSNKVISMDKNGKLYYTLNLPEYMEKINDTKERMQYMLFK